ncbi:MAG: hypothetical protein IJF56_00215, partial [Clostridia bacterium]|nr:hypothetical protein [Clostridia bacterium]
EMGKHNPMDLLQSAFTEREKAIIRSFGGWGGTWGGHSVPNLIDFARYGTLKLREKVLHYKSVNTDAADFYDGILLLLDAVDVLGARFYDLAVRAAASCTDDHREKLERLAKTFARCPRYPAETFADACAVYVMLFTLDGIDSPGHFDWYMIDFWECSDYAESREMLEDLWEFFHRTRTWNLCIGGSDVNWNDRSNALTYEILDVVLKYKYNTPNLTMRCHRNTPDALWSAAMKTLAAGTGLPALYNDEAVCPALERLGISAEDAHEYVMNGCNQIDIQGKSHMGLEDGEVNLGMAVELAFFDGVCQKTGCKIGENTGDVSAFDTFDAFYNAVRTQMFSLCDAVCGMANKSQRIFAAHTANPIRSLTTEGCLEKARDYKNGGPLYGHGQILLEGVPDAVDSLAAVKRYVYEEKRFTITELRDALKANFEGYPEVFNILRHSSLRYGNDDPAVDTLAGQLLQDCNTYLLKKPTVRGGFYGGGCSPFVRAADNGGAVGALPNGKKAGEDLYGDSIGATPGRDRNGPTALLNSCLHIDQTLPTSGFILNLKFDRKMLESEQGKAALTALCRTYFAERGQQLSVTSVSREDLLDALEHPENHGNLIVRVGGFSEYFVNLSPALQNNVLMRTDNTI